MPWQIYTYYVVSTGMRRATAHARSNCAVGTVKFNHVNFNFPHFATFYNMSEDGSNAAGEGIAQNKLR